MTVTKTHVVVVSASLTRTQKSVTTIQQTVVVTHTETDIATHDAELDVSTTVTYDATIDETATASAVQTDSVEISATAYDTETTVLYSTTTVVDSETVEVTQTETATATATVGPPSRTCDQLPDPYTAPNGVRINTYCDHFYPIFGSAFIDSGNYGQISDCYNHCSTTPGCAGVDYDPYSGLCDTFSSYVNNTVTQGYNSGLVIV